MPTFVWKSGGGTVRLSYTFWDGRQLRSCRECPVGLHVATETVADPRTVPRLALVAASDGRDQVLVHPDRLADFLTVHKASFFVGHDVAPGFWALDQHLGKQNKELAGRVLWDACDQGRLLDTQILDLLLQLATGKFRRAGCQRRHEAGVSPGSLAAVAAGYTALRLAEDDTDRERCGELVGLSFDAWARVDPGFFASAARHAAATRRLYPALAEEAYGLERFAAGCSEPAGSSRRDKPGGSLHPVAKRSNGRARLRPPTPVATTSAPTPSRSSATCPRSFT
jgi:hypothetical protein